jgi:hemoglobin
MRHNVDVRVRSLVLLLAGVLLAGAASLAAAQSAPAPAERTPGAADPAPPNPAPPNPAPPHPELAGVFEDFGGRAGLDALMEEFMAVLLADPRMRPFFEKVEHDRVKRQLAEQFCAILGGGCAYSGRDMVAAHAAHGIDRADFNALVEDLQIAMSKRGIPFRAQNKLLAVLAPMHRDVINR